MPSLPRLITTFFKALSLTLQGKTPQLSPLALWIKQGQTLVSACMNAADHAHLNAEARRQMVLRLDSRNISMEVILGAVRHNLMTEYPLLLREADAAGHYLTTLYALNLNDHYRVAQLAQHPPLSAYPTVQTAVQALSQHLEQIPPRDRALIKA